MSRRVPTSNIDVIGHLAFSPENATGNFIESRQQNAFFIKPPNCDSAGDSIELFLIRSQCEREAMQQLQSDLLAHNKAQAAVSESRLRKLNKIQLNLRKRLVEVSSFIKDCEDKRTVAEKKVNEELEKHERLHEDIEHFSKSIQTLAAFRKQLKSTVKEYGSYEQVMQDVVAESNIFDSIKDCIDRCDALMLTQVEINEMEQEKIQEIEEMHKHMTKVISDAASTVMGLQNDLAELDRSYNQMNQRAEKWEKILATAKTVVAQNDSLKANTLGGIRLMYVMLCQRRLINPVYQRHEVEAELDFIKDEIEILHDVVEKCNRDNAKNIEDKEKYDKGCF